MNDVIFDNQSNLFHITYRNKEQSSVMYRYLEPTFLKIDSPPLNTLKLHPNILLPHNWGIKTPITLYYSNSVSTPKYHPGSDILTDINDTDYDIEKIQTRNQKYSFSTSFNKATRSPHWLIKRTIDNISLSYSAIRSEKSNNQIDQEIKNDYEVSGNYSYNWGKENYFTPFNFTQDWFFIGSILGQSRYYYTPEKFSTSVRFSESDKVTTQRSNLNSSTETYSFNMQRKFILNHKFTKTLSTNYTRQIDSNLEKFRDDKWAIIKNMDPGKIEGISEKFSNTLAPEFLEWLNPNFTFNQTYTWSSQNGETANIKSSPTFKTKVGVLLIDSKTDFIFYLRSSLHFASGKILLTYVCIYIEQDC